MSSGDSQAQPTYYFSGMTFNPDFYQSTISKISTKKNPIYNHRIRFKV